VQPLRGGAAALFGGGKVGFCRYEYNDVVQSEAMDTLLRLCAAVPENLRHVARLKGVRLSEETIARLEAALQDEPPQCHGV
jgi:hypothetical protein